MRRLLLALLVLAIPACAGGPDVEDPLAPVPTEVDPRDVAPPNLRQAWSVEVTLDETLTIEDRDPDEDEEDTPVPTVAPALGTHLAYVAYGHRLVALDVEDGSTDWEVAAPGPLALAPVIMGDVAAVATDGRWTWIDRRGRVDAVLAAPGMPGAAIAVGELLVETREGEVRAISREPETGSPAVSWTRPLEGAAFLTSSPDDATVVVVDESGGVHAVAAGDGALRWTREDAQAIAAPVAVDDRRVYVSGRDRHLRALDRRDGDRDWRSRPFGVDLAGAPAAAGNVVWVGGMAASLQGLAADTGSSLFRIRLPSRSYLDLVRWGPWIIASPTYGPWTVVRGPLRAAGPANPGTPVSYTISSGNHELMLPPAAGPQGVLLVDAGGTVRLITPQRRGPLRSPIRDGDGRERDGS